MILGGLIGRAVTVNVALRLVTGNSAQLLKRLEDFSIDIAVTAGRPAEPSFLSRKLRSDRLVAVVAPLLLDADQRHAMELAAASHGQRDADERLRALVLEAVSAPTDAGGQR